MRELANLVRLLKEDVFVDSQQPWYVVIDDLDEDWAEDTIRFRLIKGLIEAIRKLIKVRNVKIVIALRDDLFHAVVRSTKTTGSQEEKYEALFLDLRWTRRQLRDLLDLRVNQLFKRKYTNATVGIDDILPSTKTKILYKDPLDYILERSFLRPRDAIQFFNEGFAVADGRTRLTNSIIRDAERTYSIKRLRSLYDEWRSIYPNLSDYVELLQRSKKIFVLDDIDLETIENFVINCCSASDRKRGPMYESSMAYVDQRIPKETLLLEIMSHLYRVSVIGVRNEGYEGIHWSFQDSSPITRGQSIQSSSYHIHPAFWTALGVQTGK